MPESILQNHKRQTYPKSDVKTQTVKKTTLVYVWCVDLDGSLVHFNL